MIVKETISTRGLKILVRNCWLRVPIGRISSLWIFVCVNEGDLKPPMIIGTVYILYSGIEPVSL